MHPSSLVPGNCYFYVNYSDDKLSVPHVQTLIPPYSPKGPEMTGARRILT